MSRLVRLILLMALVLVGCGSKTSTQDPNQTQSVPANAIKITFFYSPEKEKWLKSRFDAFQATSPKLNGRPIVVEGVNKSSGTARSEIARGVSKPTVWSPSSSAWLEVLKNETKQDNPTVSGKALVLTPVVISMWKSMAEALGWPNKPIGWNDLLALTADPQGWGKFGHPEWGAFTWGHTDPEISTTALSTVLAEIYTANGKTRGLTVADVQGQKSKDFLTSLSLSIKHYGENTLIFSENMKKFGRSYISAFPMEEITLIDFNQGGPTEPLVAIYPREGTFYHDNPFFVMNTASSEEQQAAQQLYDFLLTPESQTAAMQYGFRPANPNVQLAAPLTPALGVDPNQPQTTLEVPAGDVLVAAKQSWANNRKRADIVLLVDVSGSMLNDQKIDQAKAGLELFVSRLLPEDRVSLIAFSADVQTLVPMGLLKENRAQLEAAITNLQAEGETRLYDGLAEALKTTRESTDRSRIKAVIVLSDGANHTNSPTTFDQVKQEFGETGVSIFPIAYGSDADEGALTQIAELGRTRLIKGSSTDINVIFEQLSRYF